MKKKKQKKFFEKYNMWNEKVIAVISRIEMTKEESVHLKIDGYKLFNLKNRERNSIRKMKNKNQV